MKSERKYEDDQKAAVAFAGICFILMAVFAIIGIVYGLVRSII